MCEMTFVWIYQKYGLCTSKKKIENNPLRGDGMGGPIQDKK